MSLPVQHLDQGTSAGKVHAELVEWEGRPVAEIARLWQVPELRILSIVGSTNDLAKARASAGAPAGTVVLAERQEAGRGRAGRAWSSPPGLGLYLSVVARPDALFAPSYPLRVAVAIAGALDSWTAGGVAIKWPNDLLLHGKKIGGILCEAVWLGDSMEHLIIGVGLNVLHHDEDFPPELQDVAGSLRSAAPAISRFDVATEIVRSLNTLISNDPSDQADLSRWRADLERRNALKGRHVHVFDPESGRLIAAGKVRGIAGDGALELLQNGEIFQIRSGTIRLAGGLPG